MVNMYGLTDRIACLGKEEVDDKPENTKHDEVHPEEPTPYVKMTMSMYDDEWNDRHLHPFSLAR